MCKILGQHPSFRPSSVTRRVCSFEMTNNSTLCDDGASAEELTANILGIIGGLMLAVCLAPQLIQTWRTRSVDDVAYGWLAAYFTGLILNLAYFILIDAVVAWATLSLEIAFCCTMIVMKILFTTKADKEVAGQDTIESPAPEGDKLAIGTHSTDTQAIPRTAMLSRVKSGRFAGSFALGRTSSLKAKENNTTYGARHFHFDYTFARVTEGSTLAEAVLSLMKQVCDSNGVKCRHSHIEKFGQEDDSALLAPMPAGGDVAVGGEEREGRPCASFAVSLFTGERHVSHIAAHCWPEQGLLALDVFSCGGKMEAAQDVAKALHSGVLALPNLVHIDGMYRETNRFPKVVTVAPVSAMLPQTPRDEAGAIIASAGGVIQEV